MCPEMVRFKKIWVGHLQNLLQATTLKSDYQDSGLKFETFLSICCVTLGELLNCSCLISWIRNMIVQTLLGDHENEKREAGLSLWTSG